MSAHVGPSTQGDILHKNPDTHTNKVSANLQDSGLLLLSYEQGWALVEKLVALLTGSLAEANASQDRNPKSTKSTTTRTAGKHQIR